MDTNENTFDDYQKFYAYVNNSIAFKNFCEKAYGIDLSQDGFADKKQIDFLINKLSINEYDTVLDIGCGYGKIANYIHQKTKAIIDGIDYSPIAIELAKTYESERMNFSLGDINEIIIQPSKYSKIYLIDTIYFSNNYEKTLVEIYGAIKSHGKIGIYWSDFIFNYNKQTKKIEGKETKIANILEKNGWSYKVYDFTVNHYRLMKKRRIASINLKNKFFSEGNKFLYEKINAESIDLDMNFNDFIKFGNRYFYCIEKK
jgi:ubiquinone/menaquinone biosynthesis C-methylase UbiE